MSQLKLGLPKGSLEKSTIELFRKSGWKITGMDRSYFPSIDDKTLNCSVVRAQEMSRYVEDGTLDAGITGRDWIQENDSQVEYITELIYAKTSFRPTRWVLAVPHDSPVQKIEDLKGKKVATEMVNFTRRLFEAHDTPVDVEFSWGATEAKAAEGLADAIVEVTETGGTIRAHGLRIVCDLLESAPQLIANKDRLAGPLEARQDRADQHVAAGSPGRRAQGRHQDERDGRPIWRRLSSLIPSVTAPTVATLYDTPALKGKKWFSIESIIAEEVVRELIPELIRNGAVGIVEYPLNKVV